MNFREFFKNNALLNPKLDVATRIQTCTTFISFDTEIYERDRILFLSFFGCQKHDGEKYIFLLWLSNLALHSRVIFFN